MDDGKLMRSLIGYTGLALLCLGWVMPTVFSFPAGGLLGLIAAFGLDFVERRRKPDLRERKAHDILRRKLRT